PLPSVLADAGRAMCALRRSRMIRKSLKKVAAPPMPTPRRARGKAPVVTKPSRPGSRSKARAAAPSPLVSEHVGEHTDSEMVEAAEPELAGEGAGPEGEGGAGSASSIAEMEAVADYEDEGASAEAEGDEPDAEPETARSDDEPSNFLALYFREMAQL